jgi:hypothetical protein
MATTTATPKAYAPITMPALEERIKLAERALCDRLFADRDTPEEEALRAYLVSLYLARPARVYGFKLTGLTTKVGKRQLPVPDLTIWRRGRSIDEAEVKAADAVRALDLVALGECSECEGIGRVIGEAGPCVCPVCRDADGTI